MANQLPPLTALRTFEAAARHESYVRAADELNVTPAAVSHQIKVLEEFLGCTLFQRQSRGVRLTEAARSALADIQQAFGLISNSVNNLRTRRTPETLVASVVPSFAIKWLVHRLERFSILHPGIDVRISASREQVDLQRTDIDLAIRFGMGNYPGLQVVELFRESVIPLYNPALIEDAPLLEKPTDLRHHTLLHDDSIFFDPQAPDWSTWLDAAGVKGVDASLGLRFSHPEHAIQAAISGAGVALSRRSLAADDITHGRLVIPFDLDLPIHPAYYALTTLASLNQPKVRAFWDWLRIEAKNSAKNEKGNR